MQSPLVTEALTTIDHSSVVELCVTVEDHRILHNYGVYRNGAAKNIKISYQKSGKGCIFGMDEKRELIANGDFFNLSKQHLMSFLTSVHMLSSLSIEGLTTSGDFLYRSCLHHVELILKKRNNLLKVNEFVVSIPSEKSQDHVVSLVAMLNREALEEVHLKTTSSITQWPKFLERLSNLPDAAIIMETNDNRDLEFLKEHCVRSPFGKLVLQCSFDGNQACELLGFGAPVYVKSSIPIWFFPSQDQEVSIRMEQGFSGNISTFTFSRVSLAQMLQEIHPSSIPTFDLEKLTGHRPVMDQIWENLPFISKLALRDVSTGLRDYLDDGRLHCWPIKMEVQFNEISAIVRMLCNGEEISRPCTDMALLKEWLNRQESLHNFSNRKPSFETFLCDFDGYTLEKMQNLGIFLSSFRNKISMAHLELKGSSELEFIRLLDCLDEKKLRKLTIFATVSDVNNGNHALVFDQITDTPQWNHATELVVEGANVSVSVQKLVHFLKVTASIETIPVEDVLFLAQELLDSSLPRNFKLSTFDNFDLQSLIHSIGCPPNSETIDGVVQNKWVLQGKEKHLKISVEDDVFTSIQVCI